MYGSNSGKHLSRWLTSSIHLPTFLIMKLSAYQKFFPALVWCYACWPQRARHYLGQFERTVPRGWKCSVSTAGWVHWLASTAQAVLVKPSVLCSLQYICFFLFIFIFPIYCYSFWRESITIPQNYLTSFASFPFNECTCPDTCFCACPAWSFRMFCLSLAAIWEAFLYQIL